VIDWDDALKDVQRCWVKAHQGCRRVCWPDAAGCLLYQVTVHCCPLCQELGLGISCSEQK
jgi:hypothetical protein